MPTKAKSTDSIGETVKKKKRSAAFHNALMNIKSHKKTMILIAALHMLAFPLVFIMAAIETITGSGNIDGDVYSIIAAIVTFAAVLCGIIFAANSFGYLYKKTDTDMHLSLPLSKKKKFLSDFFSGIFSYIAPFIAVQFFLSLIIAVFGNIYNKGAFSDAPYSAEELTELVTLYLQAVVSGVAVMILFYSLAVLVVTCCGAMFETGLYAFIVNAMIPLVIYVIAEVVMADLYGIDSWSRLEDLAVVTSPAMGIIRIIEGLVDLTTWADTLGFCAKTLVGSAIYFTASRAQYMKRRAEQTSKPFAFKWIYYFSVSAITLCIGSIGFQAFREGGDFESFVPSIIVAAFIYLALETASNRGFRGLWKGAIRYVVTFGVLFSFSYAYGATEGFGAVERVPSADRVRKVTLTYDGPTVNFDDYLSAVTVSQKDSIEAVTDLHSHILSDYKAGRDKTGYVYPDIEITYDLKGGGKIVRSYNSLIIGESFEKLARFETSEGYKKQMADSVKQSMLSRYDAIIQDNKLKIEEENDSFLIYYLTVAGTGTYDSFSDDIEDMKHTGLQISITSDYVFSDIRTASYYSSEEHDELKDRSFYEELSDALIKDISAETPDLWLAGSADAFLLEVFRGDYEFSFEIKDHYVNVREFLKTNDFTVPEMDKTDEQIEDVLNSSDMRIFSYDDYKASTLENAEEERQ